MLRSIVTPARALQPLSPAQREALMFSLMLCIVVLLAGAAARAAGVIGMTGVASATVILVVGSLLVVRALPFSHGASAPHPRYGAANRVTQVRLALGALLGGLVTETMGGPASAPGAPLAWAVAAYVGVAAALDAADGPLARRQGLASTLGARFDMEVDALLILLLSLLCWRWDRAGAWVVLAGALRYAFVAAAWRHPWLTAPLPPSRRRQTVCVLQIVALIACLMPLFERPAAATIAGFGLLLLTASFAIDIAWLARRRA